MFCVGGEVCLARHAQVGSVRDIIKLVLHAAVVAVRLVVAYCYHVGFCRCEWGQLVVELLVELLVAFYHCCFVDFGVLGAEEVLRRRFEEVVGVG